MLRVFKYAAVASATCLVAAQQSNKYNKTPNKKGKGEGKKSYYNGGASNSKNDKMPSTNDYNKEKAASGGNYYSPFPDNKENKNYDTSFDHGEKTASHGEYNPRDNFDHSDFDHSGHYTEEDYNPSEMNYYPPPRGEFEHDYGTDAGTGAADFYDQTFDHDQSFDFGTGSDHNNEYYYGETVGGSPDHDGENHDGKMWNRENNNNNMNKPTTEEWEQMSQAEREDWKRENKPAFDHSNSFPTKEEFDQMSEEEQKQFMEEMKNNKKGNKKGKGKGKNKNMQNMPAKEEWEQMSEADREEWMRENKPAFDNVPSKEEFEQMSEEEQQNFKDQMKNKNKNNKKGKGKNNKNKNKDDKYTRPPRSDEDALEFADDDAFVLIDQAEARLREMRFELDSMRAAYETLEEGDTTTRELLSEDIDLLTAEIAAREEELAEQKSAHRGNLDDKLSRCKEKLEALKAGDYQSDPKSAKLIGKSEELIAKAEKHQQERAAYESMSDAEKQAFRDAKRQEKQEKQRQKMQDRISKIEDPAQKQKAEEKLAAFEAARAKIEAMSDAERKEYLKEKRAERLEDKKDLNADLSEPKYGFDIKKETNATLEIIGASEGAYSLESDEARAVLGAAIADAAGVDVSDVEVGEVVEDSGELQAVVPEANAATTNAADNFDASSTSSSDTSTSSPAYAQVPATAPTKRFLQKQTTPSTPTTGDSSGSANKSKVFRASYKYGVKSDSEAKARYVEKALTQRGFGDAVVTGFNSRKLNDNMEFGGAMNKDIQTNDVLVEKNNDSDDEDNTIEKFMNDAKDLSWQMIAALLGVGMVIAALLTCLCRSCCGSKSNASQKNRPAVELKINNQSSYAQRVDSGSLEASQAVYTPTVAWTRVARPASLSKE